MKYLSGILNRVLLFSAGVGLLYWGYSQASTHVTAVVATRAFINGRIVTIDSPIGGQVKTAVALESGKSVSPGLKLLQVTDNLENSEWLRNAKFDLTGEQAKLASIEAQIRTIKSQKFYFTEMSPESEAVSPNLSMPNLEPEPILTNLPIRLGEQNIKQIQSELKTAASQEQLAKGKYEKLNGLAKEGAIAKFAVDEAYNHWQSAQNQIEGIEAKLVAAKLQIEQQRLQLVEQQRSHLLKQQQIKAQWVQNQRQELERINKIKVQQSRMELLKNQQFLQFTQAQQERIESLVQQQTELQARIEEKQKAIAQAEKTANYNAATTNDGIVWEVLAQNGDQITPGQPLVKILNCQHLWVDAFVSIDDLKRIQIGSPAEVTLHANKQKLNGIVKTIRSHSEGAAKLGHDAAVTPPDINAQQLAQVRIELDNTVTLVKNDLSAANFCNVGQMAKVKIGQNASFTSLPMPKF